jgi:hypothetical protein
MSVPGVTVPGVDTSVILYAAELEAPALKQTARRFLESEARRLGVPLDPPTSCCRAQDGSEMHIVGAACELVAHLGASETNPLCEDSPVIVLAQAGTLVLMSQIELDGNL